jgi:hypothetical protein
LRQTLRPSPYPLPEGEGDLSLYVTFCAKPKGGVDARSRKCRGATLARADGVVISARLSGETFRRDDHPVRSVQGGFATSFGVAATPPFQVSRRGMFLVSKLTLSALFAFARTGRRSRSWNLKKRGWERASIRAFCFCADGKAFPELEFEKARMGTGKHPRFLVLCGWEDVSGSRI